MAMLMSPVQRRQWPNMYAPPTGKLNRRQRTNSEMVPQGQAHLSKSQGQIRRAFSNRIFQRKRTTSMPENLDAATPAPATKQPSLQIRPRMRANTLTSSLQKPLAPIPEFAPAPAPEVAPVAEPEIIPKPPAQDSEANWRRQMAIKRIQELKQKPSHYRRRSISDSEVIERMRKKLAKCENGEDKDDDTQTDGQELSKLKKLRQFFMRIRKRSH